MKAYIEEVRKLDRVVNTAIVFGYVSLEYLVLGAAEAIIEDKDKTLIGVFVDVIASHTAITRNVALPSIANSVLKSNMFVWFRSRVNMVTRKKCDNVKIAFWAKS